jgi:hypothetical protein
MQRLIKNGWRYNPGEPFACTQVLEHKVHPEGLNLDRIRFFKAGSYAPESKVGHIISVIRGSARLLLGKNSKQTLQIGKGVHFYLPPDLKSVLEAESGVELLRISSPSASQTRGRNFLLRNEIFLAACSSGLQSLRWILTPQYLSRRIFLNHDFTLLSKSGNPVSWFHTTMFDVAGLPHNEDGHPVFKMSYNSRTEVNVCYDVQGNARTRMALHPYRQKAQLWEPWLPLDNDSTYHLNEAAGCPSEECYIDKETQTVRTLRNKHEVHIVDGYVSLFCMFDPAPTGIERHQPGEYSDYEPLSEVLKNPAYDNYMIEISELDKMVDRLSLAEAMGELESLHGTPIWELYLRGKEAQETIEARLAMDLEEEGKGRERVISQWMCHD